MLKKAWENVDIMNKEVRNFRCDIKNVKKEFNGNLWNEKYNFWNLLDEINNIWDAKMKKKQWT